MERFTANSAPSLFNIPERACFSFEKKNGRTEHREKDSKRKTQHHFIFIISQMWLTTHPRSTVILLNIGTPGTSRKIYSEDADGETRTRNPSVINRAL